MAFKFTWPTFSASFYETASNLLTSALSKAPMPPIITDNIVVKEFNLGTTPPDLEMLEIGELGEDKFRGVFKLKYSGDAHIVLQTKVQVNITLLPSYTRKHIYLKGFIGQSSQHTKSSYPVIHITRRSRCRHTLNRTHVSPS